MITLTSLSHTPIYQQIIDQILAQIACGILPPDAQLPGVRNLAKDLGINPNTVVKAYNELEHAGVLYSKPGIGSFVKALPNEQARLSEIKLAELQEQLSFAKRLGIPKARIQEILDALYDTHAKETSL